MPLGFGALSVGVGIWNLALPVATPRPRATALPAVLPSHGAVGYGLALHVTAFRAGAGAMPPGPRRTARHECRAPAHPWHQSPREHSVKDQVP